MIDLFLTNNKTLFCDVKAIPSVSMDGGHRLVVAKIKIRKPKIRKCAPMKKYKLNKLDSDETRTTLKNVISAKLQQENEVEQAVEDMWGGGDFKRKMMEAADEVQGEKVAYRGKKKMTPWWTDDVRDAVKRKMCLSENGWSHKGMMTGLSTLLPEMRLND